MHEEQARQWALTRAIEEAPSGTTWPAVMTLAEKFAQYVLNGTIPEDAKADNQSNIK